MVNKNQKIKKLLMNNTVLLTAILASVIILFSSINSNFFAYINIISLLNHLSYIAIIAAPLTIVFLLGEIDISFGGVIALTSMIIAIMNKAGIDIRIAIFTSLLAGLIFGAINGFLVSKIGINSIIATLGTMLISTGTAYIISGTGRSILVYEKILGMIGRGGLKIFTNDITDVIYYLPFPIIIAMTTYFLFWFILKYTNLGRQIFAIGQNKRASHLMGVKVVNLTFFSFVLTGLYASFSGIILTSQATTGMPQHGSYNMMLSTIAGIILGGSKLGGGKGGVIGTLMGVTIISIIYNGLALRSLQQYIILIFTGLLFLIVVSGYEIKDKIIKSK